MESWGSMNNIIVITDSAKIADTEFKSLRQSLTDKGILVKADAVNWILFTKNLAISFWNADGGWYRLILTSNIIGYSNCHIGKFTDAPILARIRMWQMIGGLMCNLPRDAEEIPYRCIEDLSVFEERKKMSIADVISSIEKGMFREVQARENGNSNGEPIDCSALGTSRLLRQIMKQIEEHWKNVLRSEYEEITK